MDTFSDWTSIRAFVAVAESGSLSGAAQALGLTQPTVGRQIKALELSLGTRLFDRHPRGLTLTEAGRALLPGAEAMRDGAARLALAAAGHEDAPSGTVRLTASIFVSHHILPPILAELRRTHPGISLELVPSDRVENLLFREADIALRMVRPTQADVVTLHVTELALGLYASQGYFARRGAPDTPEELRHHDLVGYDRNEVLIEGFRAQGFDVSRDSFAVRCDLQSTYWELVRAGCGIGVGQLGVAARDPEVVRVLPDLPLPSLPVWLTSAPELRRTARVDAVWRALARGLRAA